MKHLRGVIKAITKQLDNCQGSGLFNLSDPIPALPPAEAYQKGKEEGLRLALNILLKYRKEVSLER